MLTLEQDYPEVVEIEEMNKKKRCGHRDSAVAHCAVLLCCFKALLEDFNALQESIKRG